ncbi:MAG: hypothetical protein ACLP7F_02650 [Acidimicrobiales bacterium]
MPAASGGVRLPGAAPELRSVTALHKTALHKRVRASVLRPKTQSVKPEYATVGQLTTVYLCVRALLLVADILAAHISYGGHLGGPVGAWDSHFYLSVAQSGYPAVAAKVGGQLTYSSAGVSPVFPFCIWLVRWFGVPALGAGIVVSAISGWVATMIVWQLGTAIGGEELGYGSALLFMVFPGMAISWGLTYCECVGTALVAGALMMMTNKRWFIAGVLGAFATATSPVALMLVPAALVPAVQAVRRRQAPAALLTATIAPVGFLGFALWEAVQYHDLLFYWHLQHQAWGDSVDFGRSFIRLLLHPWQGGYQGKGWLMWVGLVAVLFACVALGKAKLPGFITAYSVSVFVLLFITNEGFKPRLLTWAFPALIAVAATMKSRSRQTLVTAFAALMIVVFFAYVLLGNTMVQP